MKIEMGSMSEEEEIQMIGRFIEDQPLEHLGAVVSLQEISSVRADCRRVYVHDDLRRYVAQLVQRTRNRISGSMAQGVSPRGTLSLIRAAQGYALVQRDHFRQGEEGAGEHCSVRCRGSDGRLETLMRR